MTNELMIADRRTLISRARRDAGFRTRLQQDGVAAIAEVIGVTLPATMRVHVVEEPGDGHFIGTLPREGALADGLPDPARFRDAWENLLLSTVFLDAEARADLLEDPVRYAQDLAGNFPGTRLDILEETASETYLVIDHIGAVDDELDAFALDLVTGGGGNPNCQLATTGSSRSKQV